MFTIEMLPASQGDCLWIEYGDPAKPYRILIDGGVVGTYKAIKQRILALPPDNRRFELIIISHVDRDHIEGLIRLLNDEELKFDVGDVWFNAYQHLVDPDLSIRDLNDDDSDDIMGPRQGEYMSALLLKRGWQANWNKAFDGKAIHIGDGDLPIRKLLGRLTLTLMSPAWNGLSDLKTTWEDKLSGHFDPGDFDAALEDLAHRSEFDADDILGDSPDIETLVNAKFEEDTSKSNASSIAVLVTYDEKSYLLAGDAWPSTLIESISRLLDASGEWRLPLEAFKISHHGGKKNLNQELLEMIDCFRYLVLTNGSYYRHPHKETIARIIRYGGEEPILTFNYRVKDKNLVWNDSTLMLGIMGQDSYQTIYPPVGQDGLCVEFSLE